MTTIAHLRALAEAAQAVPRIPVDDWHRAKELLDDGHIPRDAEFIAACTPSRILALLRVVEAAEETLDGFDDPYFLASLRLALSALNESTP